MTPSSFCGEKKNFLLQRKGTAKLLAGLIGVIAIIFSLKLASNTPEEPQTFLLQIEAHDKYQRSAIADTGAAILKVEPHFVYATATQEEYEALQLLPLSLSPLSQLDLLDYPSKDEKFHNFDELLAAMDLLTNQYPDLVQQEVIGESIEGRPIINLRLSSAQSSEDLPSIVFMGGHHAREHLSVEMPLMLAQHLAREHSKGNPQITQLLASREINIIPIVNPDGAEYDIEGGRYKMWRKNRRKIAGSQRGVDLNRNYGFRWGTGGSSKNPQSDVYMGEAPFSEPETLAIKNFIDRKPNTNILLSFHTFSELILYPWGHTYDSIREQKDFLVHKKLAETMAKMNNYKPQQSSDLYIASGDTTDWSYGVHGIISFTFELDPKDQWSGGFYPGQRYIDIVFEKNLKPCLYLIEKASDPYQVLSEG